MSVCVEDNVLEELIKLLKLEKIEENIFRGQSQDLGYRSVYGGQVLGQALSAACQTVPKDRRIHSLHAYFLRMGDARKPIVYDVDCIRDGKSFTTRRVVAIQKGRAVFSMSASFQVDEPGFEHQDAPPSVPGPEGLESDIEFALRHQDKIPAAIREKIICRRPIEMRPVNPIKPFAPEKREPVRYTWFKTIDRMPDDPAVHRYLLAYASDFGLVVTALYPHGHSYWEPSMQVASLDHAMWFHRDFRIDDWLLYVMKSPNACKARGLASGRIYTRDGRLIASVVQEGLIRYHDDPHQGIP
ncbi:acyl-CoA thioesterase II [Desulfococcus multivorans]|jgi:acyl-CoA thioesterase-2|uniref:Acyl-CoA thioesterase 2 n=2 Tax=Desulfococcus TaxID=896 RepID=S7U6B5_DESML|nr:acyl-CoA thioesterase II [Desulfococcus multivorans]AOY59065.1 TesB: acyl-CoA thioesterase 2 [Desulfococcus multivorans]AQV01314.1 acyl-CoA thioesterase II [Desulfococcus multivorans]EPR44877.1 acyl-CoA thioesterase II [Desulfococcus multivorans DSM 2059]MDX9817996.1 acyl-CoA thioesterase II [Desulfococcus multivorans]SJZ82403.1 acyl-CoA thioesterase-2 [Desulfococcus multivorans DSM 2059]